MIIYNRSTYFDMVRGPLFGGHLDQGQVDGQNAILGIWESHYPVGDVRWLGYCLATAFHETAQTMLPIEEYGHGAGQPYGATDPETGQAYFGRGLVQLTWRENYARADKELRLSGNKSCEWHADNALDPGIASAIMFIGMHQGWFRSDSKGACNLPRYFHDHVDDPFNARDIINGDKTLVPEWSNGKNMGTIIKQYYMDFTAALNKARREVENELVVRVIVPKGIKVIVEEI